MPTVTLNSNAPFDQTGLTDGGFYGLFFKNPSTNPVAATTVQVEAEVDVNDWKPVAQLSNYADHQVIPILPGTKLRLTRKNGSDTVKVRITKAAP